MGAQLALYEPPPLRGRSTQRAVRPPLAGPVAHRPDARRTPEPHVPLCASCHAREARYGFQPDADDPLVERPRALCFECFRVEMDRRQEVTRAVQARLPLDRALDALSRRRRRAQIAARRALGV